jgi:hypothetical protein
VTLVPQKYGDFCSFLPSHPKKEKKKKKRKALVQLALGFFVSPQCENLAPKKLKKLSIIFMFSCIFIISCTFLISELLKFVLQISSLYLIFKIYTRVTQIDGVCGQSR